MKKFFCLIIGHKIDKTYCPYTKQVYNSCTRCMQKHRTVLRFK